MMPLAAIVVATQLGSSPCFPAPALTQSTLVVEVVDQLWLPLPGASVTLESKDETIRLKETTNRDGVIGFSVPRGVYSITVALEGFHRKTVKSVGVTAKPADSIPRVQVQIQLKALREVIE